MEGEREVSVGSSSDESVDAGERTPATGDAGDSVPGVGHCPRVKNVAWVRRGRRSGGRRHRHDVTGAARKRRRGTCRAVERASRDRR